MRLQSPHFPSGNLTHHVGDDYCVLYEIRLRVLLLVDSHHKAWKVFLH